MGADIAIHWLLELGGSGAWACLRRRCEHRHHRVILDAVLTLVIAAVTVKLLG